MAANGASASAMAAAGGAASTPRSPGPAPGPGGGGVGVGDAPPPPWQVRWLRPRWDRLDPPSGVAGGGGGGGDVGTTIGADWVPVSSASAALTRGEARRALAGLRRRGALPPPPPAARGVAEAAEGGDGRGGRPGDDRGRSGSPPPPPPRSGGEEEPTPRNKNKGRRRTASPPPPPPPPGGTDAGGGAASSVPSPPPPPPSRSSYLSPTAWFRSMTSPGKGAAAPSGRPPLPNRRGSRPGGMTSPSSPTSFSTFDLPSPPPRPFPTDEAGAESEGRGEGGNEGGETSPPTPQGDTLDASTASSLLWEDMTLTSVSEEDAAAFRRYGRGRTQKASNASKTRRGPGDGASGVGGTSAFPRPRGEGERDGFDDVVLSVTVFATRPDSRGEGVQPDGGEAVVVELLSAEDPPTSSSELPAGATGTKAASNAAHRNPPATAGPSAATQQSSPSSSGSSLTAPSPPLMPVIEKEGAPSKGGCEGSSSGGGTGDGEDGSTESGGGAGRSLRWPAGVDSEEGEGASDRARVLARRVLWWPSCILSGGGVQSSRVLPSLVSLGRTTVWRDGKVASKGGEAERGGVEAIIESFAEDREEEDEDDDGNDDDDNFDNENNHGRGSQGRWQRNKVEPDERAADAMDALRSLDFLFGATTNAPSGVATAKEKARATAKSEGEEITRTKRRGKRRPLSLCLVAGDGQAYLYDALRVLLPRKDVESERCSGGEKGGGAWSKGFGALFLGSDLFGRVNEGVAPLSMPRTTVRLSSIPDAGRSGNPARTDRLAGPDDPLIWDEILERSSGADEGPGPLLDDEKVGAPREDWAGLMGAFDASADPSTLHLRTLRRSNVPTGSCVTSDDGDGYLAVCGKGLRRIPPGDDGRCRHHVLGGFVSFVSLRHGAESRVAFLPFAPTAIQAVYWLGMHFVVLLGEEGLALSDDTNPVANEGRFSDHGTFSWEGTGEDEAGGGTGCRRRRRPRAMALRVDSGREVWRNAPSRHHTLPLLDGERNGHFSARIDGPEHSGSAFSPSIISTLPEQVENDVAQFNSPRLVEDIFRLARFQSVPIDIPPLHESLGSLGELFAGEEGQLKDVRSKAIAVSSIPSSPPGIILSFQRHQSPHLVIVNHSIHAPSRSQPQDRAASGIGKPMFLSTVVRPGHRVRLEAGQQGGLSAPLATSYEDDHRFSHVWCTGGQGWSLLGVQGTGQKAFFICWDGATDDSQGPFILTLQCAVNEMSFSLSSGVMPLMSVVKLAEKNSGSFHRTAVSKFPSSTASSMLPFLQQDDLDGGFPTGYAPKRSFSITLKESIKMAADIEGRLDDIILNALDSISTPYQQSPESRGKSMIGGPRSNRRKALSHKEKSKRLLRQCSSWTQLDDSKANYAIIHGQVIVATLRVGTHLKSLSLRTNVISNPISTPFHQVLSWLCQRRDYYTAASVALSLLDDAEAVYELCGIPKSNGEELMYHKGLLDGIKPLHEDSSRGDGSDIMTSLANMAIGCLIKGGVFMSKTLEGFLSRNTLYNAPRACIMLVGVIASAVSNEPNPSHKVNKNVNIVDMLSAVESPSEDLIWPIRCLMKMAVVRKCLPSAILLINATIPNELRWRAPKSRGLASAPRPPLGLFLSIVEIILESTEDATRLLLDMTDEESGLSYWFSIDDDTKLAACLLSVRGKYVLLREPEVRAWVLERLKEEIETLTGYPFLPDGWLKEIVTGAFCNAECDISLGLDAMLMRCSTSESESSHGVDEVVCYRKDMLRVRDFLIPKHHSGGLDFDILIPALLILVHRNLEWRDSQLSTQTLLNTVCDMTGQQTIVEPMYVLDGATLMRQCALSKNVQAAAFLVGVGSRKGLILECADLIVSALAMSMRDVEISLFIGSLTELKRNMVVIHEGMEPPPELEKFTPSGNHQHILWLLEEHILKVQTYGEFDYSSKKYSGKLSPVFAGRVCFRAWYCLTHPSILSTSAKWLEEWLRLKLELSGGESPKRLACAALVRTLLWADETEELDLSDGDDEPLLAILIGFDGRFMAELARACCGLIQSIPPHLAEELMSSHGGSHVYSFDTSFIDPSSKK
ncbi:hypothetical protein ACHAWF_016409 [Thalassiosira exigua]